MSNEQVQALFRKGNEGKGIKLDYEPKLTRSKVKKVVEIEDPVPVSTVLKCTLVISVC